MVQVALISLPCLPCGSGVHLTRCRRVEDCTNLKVIVQREKSSLGHSTGPNVRDEGCNSVFHQENRIRFLLGRSKEGIARFNQHLIQIRLSDMLHPFIIKSSGGIATFLM